MSSSRAAALTIISPPEGATYLIDPTLRHELQTLPLRAADARVASSRSVTTISGGGAFQGSTH